MSTSPVHSTQIQLRFQLAHGRCAISYAWETDAAGEWHPFGDPVPVFEDGPRARFTSTTWST